MDTEDVIEIEDDKEEHSFDLTKDHLDDTSDDGTKEGQNQYDMNKKKYKKKYYLNNRYNNAYGNYSGGYGPPGGARYGPPGGGFGPPGGEFGPPGRGFGPPGGGYGPPGGFDRNFGRPSNNFGPHPSMFGPHQPPPSIWGKGFGPDGPPIRRHPMEDRTIRYLMRCGIAKEHLKNLPRDMLCMMEPEHCGLCGHSFDSFVTSRIHYISKNHLKSQKKWLNQHAENGFRRVKEVALKARELYCELCDVHITSKSHSDSHYAGKPHRAIVEGRKNPKNPSLVQRGMEDRLAQLVRREKKHLKPINEEEEAEKKLKDKEDKVILPELFCDICKTSVTCSEQMTMHLNGKRHLSKEKQHILRMMKGGSDSLADSQEKSNEDNVEEDDNETVEDSQDANEDEQKDDDWANGSGTWNDDTY